jgi:hypothetical protein
VHFGADIGLELADKNLLHPARDPGRIVEQMDHGSQREGIPHWDDSTFGSGGGKLLHIPREASQCGKAVGAVTRKPLFGHQLVAQAPLPRHLKVAAGGRQLIRAEQHAGQIAFLNGVCGAVQGF